MEKSRIEHLLALPSGEKSHHPDPLLDYCGLTDVTLRRRLETPRGLFIAESYNVIDRALRAGYTPRSILLEDKWLPKMQPLLDSLTCPIFVATASSLELLTGYHVHRGALASFHRPESTSSQHLLSTARRVAVLEDIVDHTNLGAIFRSAAALGVDGVVLTPRCADPLYRRCIRVSMGTVFQVPWTRLDSWPPNPVLHEAGFHCVGLALADHAALLPDITPRLRSYDKLALILGTEGDGISQRTLDDCDDIAMIPMHHGVDSLNVGAASAVAFYALWGECF